LLHRLASGIAKDKSSPWATFPDEVEIKMARAMQSPYLLRLVFRKVRPQFTISGIKFPVSILYFHSSTGQTINCEIGLYLNVKANLNPYKRKVKNGETLRSLVPRLP
jgi:hypothetical protein